MAKRSFLTKAAKGYSSADAANSMVRNLLSLLSIQLGGFSEDDIKEAITYFDFSCPYTGLKFPFQNFDEITDEVFKDFKAKFEIDHLIPQNKKQCGLNLPGNLVFVTKEANHSRGNSSFEDFILSNITVEGLAEASLEIRQERIEKIKKFQSDMGYSPYLSIASDIRHYLETEYIKMQEGQVQKAKAFKRYVKRLNRD